MWRASFYWTCPMSVQRQSIRLENLVRDVTKRSMIVTLHQRLKHIWSLHINWLQSSRTKMQLIFKVLSGVIFGNWNKGDHFIFYGKPCSIIRRISATHFLSFYFFFEFQVTGQTAVNGKHGKLYSNFTCTGKINCALTYTFYTALYIHCFFLQVHHQTHDKIHQSQLFLCFSCT